MSETLGLFSQLKNVSIRCTGIMLMNILHIQIMFCMCYLSLVYVYGRNFMSQYGFSSVSKQKKREEIFVITYRMAPNIKLSRLNKPLRCVLHFK